MSKCDAKDCDDYPDDIITVGDIEVRVCGGHRKAASRLAKRYSIMLLKATWDIEEQFRDAVGNLKAKEG